MIKSRLMGNSLLLALSILIFHGIWADHGAPNGKDKISFNFDTIYPPTEFKRVEAVCKELWSDLDILNGNKELHAKWIYDSDYLIDQFLALEKRIEHMIENHEEISSYLLEDIHYLAEVVEHIEKKYNQLRSALEGAGAHAIESITFLLSKTKDHIVELYRHNKEIVV